MKIAIIVRKLNLKGGVQKHVLYEARELKKLGHDVTLYTFLFSRDECYTDLLDDLKVVSLNTALPPYSNYFSWKKTESEFAKKLALAIDTDTEILNPHDHGCYKVAYYYKKLVKNIPSVWTMHDMPTRAHSAEMSAEMNGAKLPFYKKAANYFLDRYEIEKYIKKQDAVAVLDARDKEFVKKYFGKDAEIVRNGVDTERFPFYGRTAPPKKIKLFMNGIFFRHRRFEDGILAGKLLADSGYGVAVFISGDYNSDKKYYAELTRLAAGLGQGVRVEFLGKVSETRLSELYKTSDIFLFPNHMQSWGLAVFEAMASGLPVVVSKSAGASEVLTDGENALLAEPKDPGDLAKQIKKLADSPGLYSKLSVEGRRFAAENISWGSLAKNYEKIFEHAKRK